MSRARPWFFLCLTLAFAYSYSFSLAARPADLDRGSPIRDLDRIAPWIAPSVDEARLLEEDAANTSRLSDTPYRVGFPMKSDLGPANSGLWENLPEGGQIWRLKVQSKGARWIVLGFGTFRLQPGGTMTVYDPTRTEIHGPFTAKDIRTHGQLWFPPIDGDTAIVEIRWPEALRGVMPNVHLSTVSHGYKSLWLPIDQNTSDPDVLEGSGSCNNDVNCPLGDNWQDQKRSVIRLLSGGGWFCSASLINNTANDCEPYVITANHCNVNPPATTFQFNFERPVCNSGVAPTGDTVTGATFVAGYSPSDVTLLRLDTPPPDSFNVFFNGWDNSGAGPTESWGIHHPSGDVKKISFNQDPLINGIFFGDDHWRVTDWEDGTTEGGSSGSPLYDQNQRYVGQLQGGTASCISLTWDEYGKFSVSWNGGGTPTSRVRDWLDPLNSGASTLDGIDWSFCQAPQPRLDYVSSALVDAGDGDGVVEPGETIQITPTLRNGGTRTASNITGTLTTSTPLVSIVEGPLSWPNLAVDASAPANAPTGIVVDPAFCCGDTIDLTLEANATEVPGTWVSSFSLETGTATIVGNFSDDMESGAVGFVGELLGGLANPWVQTTAQSNSPSTSWFVADIGTVSDSALRMPTIAALPENAELRFAHRLNSETDFDGGVLEYSINGGATWVDAGPWIFEGPYNSTINNQFQSPLSGRSAWSGDFASWLTVRVDLSSLAGSDVTFRWRFATDFSLADEGWYIDDVVVESTTYDCGALAAPGEVLAVTVARQGARVTLGWVDPGDCGPDDYVLYVSPIGSAMNAPSCWGFLGSGNSVTTSSIPDDSNFLIVGRNASGEGSYGETSAGTPRPSANSVCP